MDWKRPTLEDLYGAEQMRMRMARGDPMHAVLGPIAHQQMAREVVGSNPMMAIPYAMFIPGYTAMKAMGLTNARSPASMGEMGAAYRGIGQGVQDWGMLKLEDLMRLAR